MLQRSSIYDAIRAFYKGYAELQSLFERTDKTDKRQVRALQKKQAQTCDLFDTLRRHVEDLERRMDMADTYRNELTPAQAKILEHLLTAEPKAKGIGEMGMYILVKDFYRMVREVERINELWGPSERQIREAQEKYLATYKVWKQIDDELLGIWDELIDMPDYYEEFPFDDED